MFFFSASFFNASYKADGILIFNALSFTFSPPLQFYYKYCCMSSASSTSFLFYFCWFCSPCQKRPSPTVTTKRRQCRKWNTQKIFAFWERFANDRHRPTFDLHQKSTKKPEKLGNVGRCTSYPYFTHARKKVKIFFYIERYGNDLHRPTSFSFFHRLEERSFSHTKQKTSLPLDFFGGLVV